MFPPKPESSLCPVPDCRANCVSPKLHPLLETPGKHPGYAASSNLDKWMDGATVSSWNQEQRRQHTSQRAKGVAQPGELKSCKGEKLEALSCTPPRPRSGMWGVQGGVRFSVLITTPSIRNTPTHPQTLSASYTYNGYPSERGKNVNY